MKPYRLFILLISVLSLLWSSPRDCMSSQLQGYTQMDIILGRLYVTAPPSRSGAINMKSLGSPRVHFQMMRDINGMATVSYRYDGKDDFGWMEIRAGIHIQEFWANRKDNRYVKFTQPRNSGEMVVETGKMTSEMWEYLKDGFEKPLEWEKLSSTTDVQSWRAKTLWELIFFQKEECHDALELLLTRLTGNKEVLTQLRRKFIVAFIQNDQNSPQTSDEASKVSVTDSEKLVLEQIRALDSDDFMTRHLADQKLRYAKPILVYMVGNQIYSELSPEAKLRLSQILTFHGELKDIRKKSQEMFLWDVQYWMEFGEMWVSVLRFGTKEQREYGWNVLQKRFLTPEMTHEMKYNPQLESDAQQDVLQQIFEYVRTKD